MSNPLPGQMSFFEASRTGRTERTGEDLRRELLASFAAGDREGAARDTGIDLAAAAQELSSPGWHDRADAALRRLAARSPVVWVDDLYKEMGLVEEVGPELRVIPGADWPSHPNSWASVWGRAKRAGVIAARPEWHKATRLPGKRRHPSPAYRSRIHKEQAA